MRVSADKLYILDSRGTLGPARDLVYNDAPWVPDQHFRFVHPKLSNEVQLVLLHHLQLLCSCVDYYYICRYADAALYCRSTTEAHDGSNVVSCGTVTDPTMCSCYPFMTM